MSALPFDIKLLKGYKKVSLIRVDLFQLIAMRAAKLRGAKLRAAAGTATDSDDELLMQAFQEDQDDDLDSGLATCSGCNERRSVS